jgi:large subunit ribosomal protein L9
MKIILTETVPGLGEAGAIKDVADGYARNYLLPKRLAVVATRGSIKQAEAQAELYARKANKAHEETQRASAAVEGKTVLIHARVGSENRLYGSVTPADLAEALMAQHGISIDRRKIELDEAIHRIGTYGATADFGNGVTARFTVEVAPEVPEATGRGRASRAAATAPEQGAAPEGEPAEAAEEPAGEAMAGAEPRLEDSALEEASANPS